jgi:thiamine biosynthesis lipoprotein
MRYFQLLFLGLVLIVASCTGSKSYHKNEGFIFGTVYHIVYNHHTDLHEGLKHKLYEVDMSLSTYKDSSIISRINTNDDTVVPDDYFLRVFEKAVEVTKKTGGAFDMTVAPLVNAWGFGFSKKATVSPELIDSLLVFVGMSKVSFIDGRIVKQDARTMLDASAIAKGYGVDVLASFLEEQGVENYMVEIGGEIRVKGKNGKGQLWRVAIDKPVDNPSRDNTECESVLSLNNVALATSGNYRNFYYENGKKYAHTISPFTGFPVQSDVLSASVIAPDCMTADAYATAFMVLGLKKSMEIVEADPELDAYFICSGAEGEMVIKYSKGFEKYIME